MGCGWTPKCAGAGARQDFRARSGRAGTIQAMSRRVSSSLLALIATVAGAPTARAQTPAQVNVTVDASAAGTALERVWPYYGADEVNYTTTPEGSDLLKTLATIHTAPVHVRNHFLLNTG